MTSEHREALDMLGISHVIDVRLLKVTASGTQQIFILSRRSFSEMACSSDVRPGLQVLSGKPPGLSVNFLSDEHSRTRWSIKFNGKLLRDQNVAITRCQTRRSWCAVFTLLRYEDLGPTHRLI